MDAESWKTAISAISAIVAMLGAYLAHRAKIQTRSDIFESQRDALVLAMVENDNRCSLIALQVANARREIASIPHGLTSAGKAEVEAFLKNLDEIEKITTTPNLREYDDKNLDDLTYSEEALATLRRMARGEQANAKHLAAEKFDFIFEVISRFVTKNS